MTIKTKLNNQSWDIQSAGKTNNMQIWSTNSGWFQIFKFVESAQKTESKTRDIKKGEEKEEWREQKTNNHNLKAGEHNLSDYSMSLTCVNGFNDPPVRRVCTRHLCGQRSWPLNLRPTAHSNAACSSFSTSQCQHSLLLSWRSEPQHNWDPGIMSPILIWCSPQPMTTCCVIRI